MEFKFWKSDNISKIAQIEKDVFSDPWSLASIEKSLSVDIFTGKVLMAEDEIVGYYGFYQILDEIHIANVAVVKEKQGNGLGDLLLLDIISECELRKVAGATLEVRKSNVKAINLYEKFQFKVEGIREKYYEDKEDAIIMWRRF